MSQNQNPRKRISKVCESLAKELDRLGIASKVELRMTNDPYSDLENIHKSMVSAFAQSQANLPQYIQNNEITILDSLRYLTNVNEDLSKFSRILYEQQQFNIELFKAFRKLYESISQVSNSIYLFESEDDNFMVEKDELISRNLQICQQISKGPPQTDKTKRSRNKQAQNVENSSIIIINSLKKEIEDLQRALQQNDEEFSIQIQRYNSVLYDQQETIRQYEVRLDKIREYEATIDDLEHKLIRLKEEKYRDDMLIENMSKKIRLYERERGGSDVFLSPRQSYGLGSPNRKHMLRSPGNKVNSSAIVSQGRSLVGEKVM